MTRQTESKSSAARDKSEKAAELRLNVRTQHLLAQLRKKNAAPEDLLADVINGKVADVHPLVVRIMEIVKSGKPPTRSDWNAIVDMTRQAYSEQSLLAHVPLDLRVSSAVSVMKHIYPTLKAQTIDADVKATVKVPTLKLALTTTRSGE